MDIFKGREKLEKTKSQLGDHVSIIRNRLTKIPERVVEIDTYPASLKQGAVPVSRENVEVTFKSFFQEHKAVFEIEADNLKLASAKKINKRWYVKYAQYYKGIPVHHAIVGLDASEHGKVGSYAANYYPDIDQPTKPGISLDKVSVSAINTYEEKDRKKLRTKEGDLIIYPEKIEDKITFHLAWKLQIVGEEPDPEIEKYFIIDAMNGQIIREYTARFPDAQVTGTVQCEVYPTNPTDPISTVPLKNQYVEIEDEGTTTTNSVGHYQKTVSWFWQFLNWPFGEATFTLNGPYAHVQNNDGTNYIETRHCNISSPCNLTWTDTDRDHINLFYHLNLFHDWLENELGYSWTNPWDGTSRFNARVNYNFNNAYAGDPMEFGTNNYVRSSDVIYHECGHNVLYEIYGDWIGFPSTHIEAYAMDEGFADYFACSFTNDSRMGEGCFGSPRNLNNNDAYPGKNSYNIEGHSGGKIIAGAAWELRQRLINIYGGPGARIADQLLLEAHQILSTYPRDYYFSDPRESNLLSALYKAADTDYNLLNGFPYFNDIQHAFHAHSLLQAVLDDGDSFDFSTNTLGRYTGGDLYNHEGEFWANNLNQQGVIDLGNIGDPDMTTVNLPTSGYTRFGVNAVSGHTYVSRAQQGELDSYIVFRVTDINANKVTVRYFYRFSPWWYIANLNSREIHKLDCHWVSQMAPGNKSYCENLQEVADLIEHSGYNGCHYCLPRYDTDTLALPTVLENLQEDLT